MKKRIYIYELDCYKVASEEQIQRMRISPERYFNLEGLPSEELGRIYMGKRKNARTVQHGK